MKKIFFVLTVGVVSLGILYTETEAEKSAVSNLNVIEFAFCKSVKSRQPVDKSEVFTPDVGKVCFWTVIAGGSEPTEIKHVWYFKDKKTAEVSLTIKSPRYRTWSSKVIAPECLGDWKVDVVDSLGNVIKSATFKIEKVEKIEKK